MRHSNRWQSIHAHAYTNFHLMRFLDSALSFHSAASSTLSSEDAPVLFSISMRPILNKIQLKISVHFVQHLLNTCHVLQLPKKKKKAKLNSFSYHFFLSNISSYHTFQLFCFWVFIWRIQNPLNFKRL